MSGTRHIPVVPPGFKIIGAIARGRYTMAIASHPLSPKSREIINRFNDLPANHVDTAAGDRVRRRIALFERIYEMTSTEMRKRLIDGAIEETDDICSWMIQLDLLEPPLDER